MLCQRVECWHKWVALFPSFALGNVVDAAVGVRPNICTDSSIELTHIWQEWLQRGALEHGAEHSPTRHMVIRAHGINREDRGSRVDLRGGTQDPCDRLGACTSAKAVLEGHALVLNLLREGLGENCPPYATSSADAPKIRKT